MDCSYRRRTSFEVADRCIGIAGGLIGIEPEVIQRAKTNRISVLVLRQRFGIPRYGTATLSDRPWCAAVSLIVECAIVCPTGFLRWRMKSDVSDVDAWSYRHTEGLNAAVQVLVV